MIINSSLESLLSDPEQFGETVPELKEEKAETKRKSFEEVWGKEEDLLEKAITFERRYWSLTGNLYPEYDPSLGPIRKWYSDLARAVLEAERQQKKASSYREMMQKIDKAYIQDNGRLHENRDGRMSFGETREMDRSLLPFPASARVEREKDDILFAYWTGPEKSRDDGYTFLGKTAIIYNDGWKEYCTYHQRVITGESTVSHVEYQCECRNAGSVSTDDLTFIRAYLGKKKQVLEKTPSEFSFGRYSWGTTSGLCFTGYMFHFECLYQLNVSYLREALPDIYKKYYKGKSELIYSFNRLLSYNDSIVNSLGGEKSVSGAGFELSKFYILHPSDEQEESYESVMKRIKKGLTGDPEKDTAYLKKQMEKYKSHSQATAILRECGRIQFDLLPKDAKEKLSQAIDKDMNLSRKVSETKALIQKGDIDGAYQLICKALEPFEKLPALFGEDSQSVYYCFKEEFELILFRAYHKVEKDIRNPGQPIDEAYLLQGYILFEKRDIDGAALALSKAQKWNPVNVDVIFESAELNKVLGKFENFRKLTSVAFQLSFRTTTIARAYRNMGYYLIEKKRYREAVGCYNLSLMYEPNSPVAQAELKYIESVSGKTVRELRPSDAELRKASERYEFPIGPDRNVVLLLRACAEEYLKNQNAAGANHYLDLLEPLIEKEV